MVKMDNQQQEEQAHKFKELTKKYFWQQKLTEIGLFILIAIGVVVAIYISGLIVKMLDPELLGINIFVCGVIGLLLFAFMGVMVFFIGGGIYVGIKEWIKSNKEKAEERARKELGVEENLIFDY